MSGETAVTTAMDTTEPAANHQNSGKSISKNAKSTDIKLQILNALRSRITYLREKSDSFTVESVRRLLEEDLGLDKYALDVHKSFVKEQLVQCLEDDGALESSQETEREDNGCRIKEGTKVSEEHEAKKDAKGETGDDEKAKGNKEALLSDIRKALRKRSLHIKANAEQITMALLRRLLEQDLKLEKNSLDPFKKFINKELDEVLQIPDSPKRTTNPKKTVKNTPSKKLESEESSDSDVEGDVDDEKKTSTQKRKLSKSEMTGKRKHENVKLVSEKKKAKHTEAESENDSDAGDSEMMEDNGNSQSSSEKPLKQTKETAPAVYGKRVEHLKSIIKSCGMSIPPAIYRKAKQAPEDKCEATLIKELEQILAKEGLSSDPSEKEIKEVKKRKNITKELEGIDTSNIVSSSRRRSTTSFAPPPNPKITAESESESEESDNGEDNEEEEEGDEKADEGSQNEEEEEEEAEEGSQSEEESNNKDDDDAEESE